MSKKKFPKTLYAKIEQENNGNEWINTAEDFTAHSEADATIEVAEYQLVRVRKLANKSELV